MCRCIYESFDLTLDMALQGLEQIPNPISLDILDGDGWSLNVEVISFRIVADRIRCGLLAMQCELPRHTSSLLLYHGLANTQAFVMTGVSFAFVDSKFFESLVYLSFWQAVHLVQYDLCFHLAEVL